MKTILIVGNAKSYLTHERGKCLIELGHKVFWFSTCDSEVPGATMIGKGLTNNRLGRRNEVQCIILFFYYLRLKPDLTHVFYAFHGMFVTLILAMMKNVVVTVMGSDILISNKYHRVNRMIIRRLLRLASAVTAKSVFLEEKLLELGVERSHLCRVNWGVDFNIFNPALNIESFREKYGLKESDYVIFSSRGCRPIYQNKLIVEGFAKFLAETGNANCYLLISVKGCETYKSYYDEIVSLVSQLKLDERIVYLPRTPHAEMPLLYNLSDISISVPYSDGMPQTLYESMACGCYPVLGNLIQYKEIDDEGGSYAEVAEFTPEAVKNTLVSVFNTRNGQDKKVLKNLKFIRNYADKNIELKKVSDLYDQIFKAV